jgi:hypothetical protein
MQNTRKISQTVRKKGEYFQRSCAAAPQAANPVQVIDNTEEER